MLQAISLSCRRGGRLVFRDVDFVLQPGGLLQVMGTNGSGKSSLLRVLAGLLVAADGHFLWNGEAVSNDAEAHHQRLHYIGHLDALKPELTSAEMLWYWRTLRPSNASTSSEADIFGIQPLLNKPIRTLSAGQKRRLTLTRLTLDHAPIWLLDEPTTALDASGQQSLMRCIAAHRAKGGIVIAAVHHPLEADNIQTLTMSERG